MIPELGPAAARHPLRGGVKCQGHISHPSVRDSQRDFKQCDPYNSMTILEVFLANWTTIHPQCFPGIPAPVPLCGQLLSASTVRNEPLKEGLRYQRVMIILTDIRQRQDM